MTDMGDWVNFFLAQVGAGAALTGLVFVGVSINLKQILDYPQLVGRAMEALIYLMLVLLAASLVLVPAQPTALLGAELLLLGLTVAGTLAHIFRLNMQVTQTEYRRLILWHFLAGEAVVALYVLAGAALLAGHTWGIYALAPGMLLCFVVAVFNAWILLIEINR